MPLKNFSKGPNDILDYVVNFGPTAAGVAPADPGWLVSGDILTGTPTVTVTGPDSALVVSTAPTITGSGTQVLFWLSSGTLDNVYSVAIRCSTMQLRTVQKSVTIDVRAG